MKKILLSIFILNTLLLASAQNNNKSILDKHIEQQLKKEKKYAKEQTFYSEENYDFKGAEVNPESLKNIKDMEPEYDFDMNDVYD
jgi:uncharacterized membrane protein YgaE (UPF0421/DUF939 family)